MSDTLKWPRVFSRKTWSYGRDIQNREYLCASVPFESLVNEFRSALASVGQSDVRFWLDPKNGRYAGDDPLLKRLQCRRASWTIRLDTVLLDKFFNGVMGIRAQYYVSPYHGGAMNARLLSALRSQLLELAKGAEPLVDHQTVQLSLDAVSSKAWISEKNLVGRKIIRASDLALAEEELQNDWLDLARAVKSGEISNEHYQLYSVALNGVRAPIADQFEVKGGWISAADRREYVTPSKHDRDCQVFMFGFT